MQQKQHEKQTQLSQYQTTVHDMLQKTAVPLLVGMSPENEERLTRSLEERWHQEKRDDAKRTFTVCAAQTIAGLAISLGTPIRPSTMMTVLTHKG